MQWKVIQRNGNIYEFDFNRISIRLKRLIEDEPKIDSSKINVPNIINSSTSIVFNENKNSITTSNDIDLATATICKNLSITEPEYFKLYTKIRISNHKKNLKTLNKDNVEQFLFSTYNYPNLNPNYVKFVKNNIDTLQSFIDYNRNNLYESVGYDTFLERYGFKKKFELNGSLIEINVETPQEMYMRIAVALHYKSDERYYSYVPDDMSETFTEDIDYFSIPYDMDTILKNIKDTYDALSNLYYTHATPTNFNAGTIMQQMASCFLMGVHDSQKGISVLNEDISLISKLAGGIGFDYTNIRPNGAFIQGTQGLSNGITPMLKIHNQTLKAFNQGGKRPGSGATYLQMHHPDLIEFLQLREPTGDEEIRTKYLFLAINISETFMYQYLRYINYITDNSADSCTDKYWYMIYSDNLNKLVLEDYSKEYNRLKDIIISYETENKINDTSMNIREFKKDNIKYLYRKAPIADIMKRIVEANCSSGLPYVIFSGSSNRLNMQKNIGPIYNSNLCSEIYLHCSDKQYAVCNLASINLPKFLEYDSEKKSWSYNYAKLREVVKLVTKNLNRVIDITYYPVAKTRYSNLSHRPIGIGIQGLADVYQILGLPFESKEASLINRKISETIYYSSLVSSNNIARNRYLLYKKHTNILMKNRYNLIKLVKNEFIKGSTEKILKKVKPYLINDTGNLTIYNLLLNGNENVLGVNLGSLDVDICKLLESYSNKNTDHNNQSRNISSSSLYSRIPNDNNNAKNYPGAYPSFSINEGNPIISKGKFHWELYNDVYGQTEFYKKVFGSEFKLSMNYDWNSLKEKIQKYGLFNSCLIALMPTSTTAQLLSNNESFEPFYSNMFVKGNLTNKLTIFNKHLVKVLYENNLWTDDIRNFIIENSGSVAKLNCSQEFKDIFKTAFEIDQLSIIKQAVERQPFVDQGQSMNISMPIIDEETFIRCIVYGFRLGLKTGKYYLRTLPATNNIKLTNTNLNNVKLDINSNKIQIDNETDSQEVCDSCSA